MKVDRVTAFIASEKLLPKRRQRQRPLRQEHERNFGNPLEGVLINLRRPGRAPEELLVAHRMHQVDGRPDPAVEARRLLEEGGTAGAPGGGGKAADLPSHVDAECGEAEDAEDEERQEDPEKERREGTRLRHPRRRCRVLEILQRGNPRRHGR